jgi:prepilin-type N-terminal cleavage/methylation domain-containing protein
LWIETEHTRRNLPLLADLACRSPGIAVAEFDRIGMITQTRLLNRRGFTLVEMLIVVALTGVIAAIAIPMMGNTLGFFRLSGDARNLSNAIALSKMRAASVFSRVRVYIDRGNRTFHMETWDTATNKWVAETGTTSLSQGVVFSFLGVTDPPPNTQGTIAEAQTCRDNAGNPVLNTSCVIFNSRGTPIDAVTAAPLVDAVYITDNTAVYGITIAATGMVRTWKTPPNATPTWVLQ